MLHTTRKPLLLQQKIHIGTDQFTIVTQTIFVSCPPSASTPGNQIGEQLHYNLVCVAWFAYRIGFRSWLVDRAFVPQGTINSLFFFTKINKRLVITTKQE